MKRFHVHMSVDDIATACSFYSTLFGIQVESDDELAEVSDRLAEAGVTQVAQPNAACCYAQGSKSWAADPSGIAWETFNTVGEIVTYGEDRVDTRTLPRTTGACCPTAAE